MIIKADEIILPRGAEKNGKTAFRKTVVRFDEKGDKIISNDCFFHTLKLKDGTIITVTLYSYGKEAENEILRVIRNGIT